LLHFLKRILLLNPLIIFKHVIIFISINLTNFEIYNDLFRFIVG